MNSFCAEIIIDEKLVVEARTFDDKRLATLVDEVTRVLALTLAFSVMIIFPSNCILVFFASVSCHFS